MFPERAASSQVSHCLPWGLQLGMTPPTLCKDSVGCKKPLCCFQSEFISWPSSLHLSLFWKSWPHTGWPVHQLQIMSEKEAQHISECGLWNWVFSSPGAFPVGLSDVSTAKPSITYPRSHNQDKETFEASGDWCGSWVVPVSIPYAVKICIVHLICKSFKSRGRKAKTSNSEAADDRYRHASCNCASLYWASQLFQFL